MKKSFALAAAGKHPDRVLDAVKHDIRKYLRRERRRELPEGVDFLDFDCRFGRDADNAQTVHLSALTGLVDAAARDGATQVYVEILAKPGHRTQRPSSNETLPDAAPPASGDDSTKADGDGNGNGNGDGDGDGDGDGNGDGDGDADGDGTGTDPVPVRSN